MSEQLLSKLSSEGITEPTEIQAKAIPVIKEGRDVAGESATGSGKTLAFGIDMLDSFEPGQGIQGLILTPTRELAEQVKTALETYNYKNLSFLSVYGGVPIEKQLHKMGKADVVIATPGRLLDHMNRGSIRLKDIKTLVLDEADRMLDMGFIDDVEKIIKACPTERQTLLFSATMAGEIKKLANKYMDNPEYIRAEPQVDPDKLSQVYYNVQRRQKLPLLVHLLRQEEAELVMIFCNTRRITDFIADNLKANDINAIAIHGGHAQEKRSKTMQKFHGSHTEVLVCTDVAGRGIHVDNVSHIYNYDIPADPKDYVHRIGRTARAGETGKVINLLSEEDYVSFSRIQRDYSDFDIERVEPPQETKRIKILPMNQSDRGSSGNNRGGPRRGGRPQSGGFRGRGKPQRNSQDRDNRGRGKPQGDRQDKDNRGRGKPQGNNNRRGGPRNNTRKGPRPPRRN